MIRVLWDQCWRDEEDIHVFYQVIHERILPKSLRVPVGSTNGEIIEAIEVLEETKREAETSVHQAATGGH